MTDEFLSQSEIDALLDGGIPPATEPAASAPATEPAASAPPTQPDPSPAPQEPPLVARIDPARVAREQAPPRIEAPRQIATDPAPPPSIPSPAFAHTVSLPPASHRPAPSRTSSEVAQRLERLEQTVAALPNSNAARRLRARVRMLSRQARILRRHVDVLEHEITLIAEGYRPAPRRTLWSTDAYLDHLTRRRAS